MSKIINRPTGYTFPEYLGEMIKRLRRAKGWSIYQLAEKAGTTPGYISKIEARGEIPSPRLTKKLALALEIETQELAHLAKSRKIMKYIHKMHRIYTDDAPLFNRGGEA